MHQRRKGSLGKAWYQPLELKGINVGVRQVQDAQHPKLGACKFPSVQSKPRLLPLCEFLKGKSSRCNGIEMGVIHSPRQDLFSQGGTCNCSEVAESASEPVATKHPAVMDPCLLHTKRGGTGTAMQAKDQKGHFF